MSSNYKTAAEMVKLSDAFWNRLSKEEENMLITILHFIEKQANKGLRQWITKFPDDYSVISDKMIKQLENLGYYVKHTGYEMDGYRQITISWE